MKKIIVLLSLFYATSANAQTLQSVTTSGNVTGNAIRITGEGLPGVSGSDELFLGVLSAQKSNDSRAFIGWKKGFATNLTTNGSAGTLLLQPGTNQADISIDFATGLTTASLRMRIAGNGNVSIGDNSLVPSARLLIKGSGITNATTALLVQNSAGTEAFRILDNGNVGVGTTNPTYKLDVAGNGRFTTDIMVNSISIGKGSGSLASNTIIGLTAGPVNTTGFNNSFLGNFSGQFNTTGSDNSFFGYGSGSLNTGSYNSYFGSKAGQGSTSGTRNTYMGLTAGYQNTTGNDNAFIGCQSGVYSTTGSRNTFIGANGGFNFTSGNDNTIIGYGPVIYNPKSVGSGNTFIGSNISGYDPATSNSVIIADGTGNVRFYSSSNGNVGIGTTKTADLTYKLYVETGIRTRKVKIDAITWADFVFEEKYNLLPLTELEKYIKENNHLPLVPTAAEVEKDGIDLGSNQTLLLQKIEELTLYIIDLNKKNEQQQVQIQKLIEISSTQQSHIKTLLNAAGQQNENFKSRIK